MAVSTVVSNDDLARLQSLQQLKMRSGEHWDPQIYANSGLFGRDDGEIRCRFCKFWLCKEERFVTDIDKRHAASVRFPSCIYLVTKLGTKYMIQTCLEDGFGNWGPHQGCESNGRMTICGRECDVAKSRSRHSCKVTMLCAEKIRECASLMQTFEQLSRVNCMPPINQRYAGLDERMHTFANIPHDYQIRLPLIDLAYAGFYYTGKQDSLRCFYCDTVIKDWWICTDHQHPWILHAQQNDKCMYLILAEGRENITRLKSTAIPVMNRRKRRCDDDGLGEQLVKKMKSLGINT